MTLPIPSFRTLGPEAPAAPQSGSIGDVFGTHWTFKAPPLRVDPPLIDLRQLAAEFAPKPTGA